VAYQEDMSIASNAALRMAVHATVQIEGLHYWEHAPDETDYLRNPHRHVFYIKAIKRVTHSDRDVEFIALGHDLTEHLSAYYDEKRRLYNFEAMSCEDIAIELVERFELLSCTVSEDNENGATVYWAGLG